MDKDMFKYIIKMKQMDKCRCGHGLPTRGHTNVHIQMYALSLDQIHVRTHTMMHVFFCLQIVTLLK